MNKLIYLLMAVCLLNTPAHARRVGGERSFGNANNTIEQQSLNPDEAIVPNESPNKALASNASAAKTPRISTSCRETGRNSMQCQVRNIGNDTGETCVDVVKVCSDGDHTSTLCTGRLEPGEVDSKVISSFSPNIKLFTKCAGVEFRNKYSSY